MFSRSSIYIAAAILATCPSAAFQTVTTRCARSVGFHGHRHVLPPSPDSTQYLGALHDMMGHHTPSDDDDISQHEYSISSNNDDLNDEVEDEMSSIDASSASPGNNNGGYRRIEDWHEDHVKENPEEHHAITHLKRDKARWAKAFDSLNGGGI